MAWLAKACYPKGALLRKGIIHIKRYLGTHRVNRVNCHNRTFEQVSSFRLQPL
jgi:hypothetical protein